MITVYTSYFALNCNHPRAKAIADKPSFFTGKELNFFKPPAQILKAYKNGIISKSLFNTLYVDLVLNRISKFRLHNSLKNGDILLSWEKDPDDCYRHLVISFLNYNGIICKELDNHFPLQLELFQLQPLEAYQ